MSEVCSRHSSPGKPRVACGVHPSRLRKAALVSGCSVDEADQIADRHVTDLVVQYRKRFPEGDQDGVHDGDPGERSTADGRQDSAAVV